MRKYTGANSQGGYEVVQTAFACSCTDTIHALSICKFSILASRCAGAGMSTDPCFKCSLPDCNSASPFCLLRIHANRADQKRRRKQFSEITETERSSSAALFLMWRLERDAKLSEVAA